MDLRQLRYFRAVAEERSFSRAAARLHISQPPLSVHIKMLEEELGVQLLERTHRGVSLTPAGEVLYEEALVLLRRLEEAKIKTQQAGKGEIGTLSVGFVSIAGYGILPPTIKRFRERFPQVDVQLHELRAGRLDLGIGLGPVNEADLSFESVSRESLVLAVPVGHRLGPSSGPVRLKTFANEHFIIPPRDIAPGLYDQIISLCRANGFVPKVTQQARQMQTVVGLVASGMGVALVPSSVQDLKRPGVKYRALKGPAGSVELGLLKVRGHNSAVAARFVAVLKEVAGK